LLGQLIHVQVIDHSYYLDRSKDTITEVEMLRPLRGGMTGRDGKVLARNLRQYNLFIIPGYVEHEGQLFKYISSLTGTPLNAITDRYGEILDKIDRYASGGETKREKNRRRRSARQSPHRLLRYLTFEEAGRIQTNREKFKGTHVRSRPARRYPEEEVLGHVTGYVSKLSQNQKIQEKSEYAWMKENYYHKYLGEHLNPNQLKRLEWRGSFLQGYIGRAALEDQFDMELRGIPGLQLIERDLLSGSSDQHQHIAPENGTNLELTIDTEWQSVAAKVMSDINGALVALDPETYEVRVMVSSPGFDPNRLVPPVSQEAVNDILRNSSRPLLNRATSGQYPPGSAFKTLVSIAGIESGTISASTSFNCPGTFTYGNHTWECWIYSKTKGGHGNLSVSGALERSCNVFFYKTGKRMGASALRQWARRFGFSEQTGIELPSESRGSLFGSRDIINASIGQGSLQVTPLQMARLISFVATGNPYREPTLLKHPEPSQNPQELPVDEQTLEAIREGMYDVVNSTGGTAYNPAPYLHSDELDYDIAGKTSTAQVGGDKKPHAWFVGFAPYEDPELAFVVIYEHGDGGGLNAAPLMESFFKKIDLVNNGNDASDGSSEAD
jgi:penicillin-binding protein 2